MTRGCEAPENSLSARSIMERAMAVRYSADALTSVSGVINAPSCCASVRYQFFGDSITHEDVFNATQANRRRGHAAERNSSLR